MTLFASNLLHSRFLFAFRGLTRVDVAMAATDPLFIDTLSPARHGARAGLLAFSFGSSRTDSSLLTPRRFLLGPIVAVQTLARLSFVISVIVLVHSGSTLSTRTFACASVALATSGVSYPFSSLLVLEYCMLKSMITLRVLA